MLKEFELYDGDLKVKVSITEEKKDAIIERLLKFCKEEQCVSGETLCQSDSCLIEAPNVLCDMIDDIMKFESEWVE